jgi:prephenate dehydrogenase
LQAEDRPGTMRRIVRVAILGHGRFGRALGGLLSEADIEYRALDPHNVPPAFVRAHSLQDLVEGAEVVVVAVPVPMIPQAIQNLKPALSADQLVIDVGSVKIGPEAALRRHLGSDIPWAATHPLFGPASLARGERPLRVVVCPNELHPQAAARATSFYTRIGCEVMQLSPDAHDHAMADTHALAFFVAKALIDLGVEEHPFAPPSFQAMARTIEAVRSDAGHLFHAIQSENEFAGSSRRKLIDALENIDEAINRKPENLEIFTIPDLGEKAPDLLEARDLIDEVDRELVALLARRTQLSLRAGRAKPKKVVRDVERERAVFEAREQWAEEAGLDPQAVREIFDAILRHSRRVQRTDGE